MKTSKSEAPVLQNEEISSASPRKNHDWIPKALCLLFAFFIWLYVMQVDSPEHEEVFHSVSVELINTSVLEGESGLSIYSGYGNMVDVTVIGKKSVINKLSSEDIRVNADVSDLKTAGFHSVSLKADLPAGLTLGSLSQNSIQVYCDEKASAVVDVRARLTSFTMASRLEMGELQTDYDTVVVSGPKTALSQISYALVTLDLGNVDASITATGKLSLMDSSGNRIENPYLRMSRSEVTVYVPVYTYKTLPLTVRYKYGYYNSENVNVTIQPSTLEVRGDPAVLDRLTEIVVATLDEKKIAGDVTQLAPLELESGLTAADGTENATIRVEHIGTYTHTFNVTDIDVTGAVGIRYEILDKSLSVTVRGTLEQLSRLKTTDFSAVVDLSGYSENSSGVIREPAVIRIDSTYAAGVYEIGDYSVQVKLN